MQTGIFNLLVLPNALTIEGKKFEKNAFQFHIRGCEIVSRHLINM